jgi:Tol biopolymer transport system component/tRNA A-37 threonylcarbamoyl transferase component Bud32
MIGTKLGHYDITDKLGEGGMGVVYKARDTKLNREVAIKLLPEQLATDSQRMERFRREAQVLAQLNHSGIAGIYGVEDAGDNLALVMELAEGQTLEERLATGPLPIGDALPIARQIAEAVEAAHDKGIIHRDLKPANIKVSADGQVKILDFGLAKALETDAATSTSAPNDSPTLTMAATQAGLIMGTAAYMSPEQACAKPADRRCDIWSFGVVLWEMLCGEKLFNAETVSHTLADVLRAEIDFSQLPADTPPSIQRLLRRCLERNPKRRLRDIGEARIAIEEQLADPTGASMLMDAPAAAASPRPHKLPWVAAGLLTIVAIGALAGWWQSTRPVQHSLTQFDLDLGRDTELFTDYGASTILSPDGSRMAFVSEGSDASTSLFVRQLSESEATELAGTAGARNPFFSPDGEWIGFFAQNNLKKIPVEGGAHIVLSYGVEDRGGSWGEDGQIVLGSLDGPLRRVSAAGGRVEPLTELSDGELSHRWPQVLPGGKTILFTSSVTGFQANLDYGGIVVQSLETRERTTLHQGGSYGRYLPSGHLAYVHQGTLYAAPMDHSRMRLLSSPVPMLDKVTAETSKGGAQFDFSQTGVFLYLKGESADVQNSVYWLDSSGETEPLLAKPSQYSAPRFSPDGEKLALVAGEGGSVDIWVYEWKRDTMTRLTFTDEFEANPVWSPDGRHIAFHSGSGGGAGSLYMIRADGSEEAQRLTEAKSGQFPRSFSPDGGRLAFSESSLGNGFDIWTLSLELDDAGQWQVGEPELFLRTPQRESQPVLSPDGRWMAYLSRESGPEEVYVRPFPGPGGKWLISNGGGAHARWSPSGRDLFYRSPANQIMVVDYTVEGDSFQASKPRLWSETRLTMTGPWANYDRHPDGKRLAVIIGEDGEDRSQPPNHPTLLLNFFDELKRRAPATGGPAQ